MPLLSDEGLPDNLKEQKPPNKPEPLYSRNAGNAANLALFIFTALAIVIGIRGAYGFMAVMAAFGVAAMVIRWGVFNDRPWARLAAITFFTVIGVVMGLSGALFMAGAAGFLNRFGLTMFDPFNDLDLSFGLWVTFIIYLLVAYLLTTKPHTWFAYQRTP